MGGIGVAEQGIEVVPDPDGVGPHLIGRPPRIPHRGDGGALRLDLDADMDGVGGVETRHAAILTHAVGNVTDDQYPDFPLFVGQLGGNDTGSSPSDHWWHVSGS